MQFVQKIYDHNAGSDLGPDLRFCMPTSAHMTL